MTSFFERKYMRHCRGVGNGGLGDDGETKKRERRGKERKEEFSKFRAFSHGEVVGNVFRTP